MRIEGASLSVHPESDLGDEPRMVLWGPWAPGASEAGNGADLVRRGSTAFARAVLYAMVRGPREPESVLRALPEEVSAVLSEALPPLWAFRPQGVVCLQPPRLAQWTKGAMVARLVERQAEAALFAEPGMDPRWVVRPLSLVEGVGWPRTPEEAWIIESVRTALNAVEYLWCGTEQRDLAELLAWRAHGVRRGSVMGVMSGRNRGDHMAVEHVRALGWKDGSEASGVYLLEAKGRRLRKDGRVGVREVADTLACPVPQRGPDPAA